MERPSFTVRYPEYGHLRAAIAFALFALVVHRATPVLAGPLAEAAGTTASRARLGFAALLWVGLGVAVVVSYVRQKRGRAPEFGARDVLVTFLDQHRPEPARHAVDGIAALFGLVIVVVGYGRFVDALDGAIVIARRLLAGAPPGSAALVSVAWGIVFLAGLVGLSIGGDRFLVGLAREALYRYHAARL
ncbi:hypothetical protein [Haloglomus litoreum]|uniref:hypothetical protein n=1 Tax=Haloglomus litoreum TaxID=3034026 RepID=UPI0023E848C4|nr:hypothetical protein [Haloglomus sp. DT116]